MFSKTRIRLVAIIMIFLVAVIATTFVVIYATTKMETTKKNKDMLKLFAEQYELHGFPDSNLDNMPEGEEPDVDMTDFHVASFFAVSYDKERKLKSLLNNPFSGFSDEELVSYADKLLDKHRNYSERKDVTYLVTEGDDYLLITMMNTAETDSAIESLIKNMFIFGTVAVLVLFGLSIVLSGWIMKPIEDAYTKQKQFISDAGHELKTPISTINANAEILQREIKDNSWLKNIIYENEKMSVLVHQLLDLSRIESVSIVKEEVNLSELAFACVMPFEATAYEKGINFDYEIADDIKVTGDSSALDKLISVLTDNAISHCEPKGNVRVRLSGDGSHCRLTVSNSGEAISEEDKKHIFERFYRSDKSRAESSGHYGLGLAIANAIVKEHKGDISIECKDNIVSFVVVL